MNLPAERLNVPQWSIGEERPQRSPCTAAISLADAGISVFPCAPNGKRPITSRGFLDASRDPAVLSRWWQRHPRANLGIPTGSRSGMVVVDIDVHASGSGFHAYERARAAGLMEGWRAIIRTPSGGLHLYYPALPGVEQRSWQAPGSHIDFRGDGGYVVAPPSALRIADRTRPYEVIAVAKHEGRPLDARALREFVDPHHRKPPKTGAVKLETSADRLADWVARRPEGGRNQGLFWAACRMTEAGEAIETAFSVLGAAAARAGLPEHESTSTIRSAYRQATPAREPSPQFDAACRGLQS